MVLLLPPKSRARAPRRIPRPDYLCSFFRTAAAGDGLYDLDLFAATGVLDKVPQVDDTIVAGVGALQASVVRLYGVVLLLSGWVRVGCARLFGVHSFERNNAEPQFRTIRKLAKALDVDPTDLLGD
jgi:hypothetical protein